MWLGTGMLVGLGHVDLVCRDLERSLAFYAAVFGPLGLEPPFLVDGERGEKIHYLRFPRVGSGSLGLRQAQVEQAFELYAPGFHHVSFVVDAREDVDAAWRGAVEAGAEVLHAPRLWPQYSEAYYALRVLLSRSGSVEDRGGVGEGRPSLTSAEPAGRLMEQSFHHVRWRPRPPAPRRSTARRSCSSASSSPHSLPR